MVKTSQLGKITKQAGLNKRAGRKYFSDLLNQQAENLQAGRQFFFEKSKRACSSNRDFRVCNLYMRMLYGSTQPKACYQKCPNAIYHGKKLCNEQRY